MIWWCVFCVCVFHLMLADRQPFGVLRWFQLFCLFHLVLAVCLPDWLGQPFFVCHQHLWFGLSFFATGICGLFAFFATGICAQSLSFMSFSAVGIRVRLFVFALLALVSGCQCCALAVVSFILVDSNWNFVQVGYPVDSPANSALKQTPFGTLP